MASAMKRCIHLLALISSGGFPLFAAESPPRAIKGNLGLSLSSGNAETLRSQLGLEMQRSTPDWTQAFRLDALYGEDEGQRTNERLQSRISLDRQLGEKYYLGLDSDFLYDAPAELDYRSGHYLSWGYYLVKSETLELSVEAGPGILWEKRGDEGLRGSAYQATQKLDWQWTPETRLFQSLQLSGGMNSAQAPVAQLEAGLESSLGGPWSLRVIGTAIHYGRNAPASGRDDLLITAGFGYDFKFKDGASGSIGEVQEQKDFIDHAWVTTALVGASFARGNSESSALSLGLLTKQRSGQREISLGLTANHAENQGRSNARNLFFDGHVEWELGARSFAGFRVDLDYDELARLDLRLALTPYAGYQLIDQDDLKLSIEAGPSALLQQKAGQSRRHLASYTAVKSEYLISPKTRLYSECGLLGKAEDFDQYLLSSKLGFEHKLAESIQLEIVLRHLYDSTPAAARESSDLSLVSGIEFEL